MLVYRGLIYLDVQKTGSTFIRSFLERHVKHKPLFTRKHAPMPPFMGFNGFLFTSSRDPFEFYLSLYKYGCDQRGGVYKRILRTNHRSLNFYDKTISGFEHWLREILDTEQNLISDAWYKRMRPELIGSLSARFLRLNVRFPEYRMSRCTSVEDVKQMYSRHALTRHYVRNENLNEDLLDLVQGPMGKFITDVQAAEDDLKSKKRINQSKADFVVGPKDINPEILQLLYDREFLFYASLGYKKY